MAAVLQPDPLCARQSNAVTGILQGAPAHLILGSQPAASNQVSRSSFVRSPALLLLRKCEDAFGFSRSDRRQEQEHSWHQFFLKPTTWWDNRRDKKSSHLPDFRLQGSGEVLWLNSMLKPAWVDEQLFSLDKQTGHGASPSQSNSPDNPEPCTRAGSEAGVVTVRILCQQGRLCEAVGALESLAQTDSPISQSLFFIVLKLCSAQKDLVVGRRVHDLVVKLGYESDAYLGNHILRMYACGGRLEEAMDVFTRVGKPNVFMWFSIISAYAKHGKPNDAIQLYHEMRRAGVKADAHVFVAALQACAFGGDLESGRKVHCDVLHSGIPLDLFVGNSLVNMYAKCGELKDARQAFDILVTKDVVTWNAMLTGYTQHGLGQEALVLYAQMEQEGLHLADHVTFACLLNACASAGALLKGRQLHSQIVERGLLEKKVLGNCLVDMYAKCGQLKDARQVFDSLATKDVVTWNVLIAGYAREGLGEEALVLFGRMEQEGLVVPNDVTFASLLTACASARAVQKGRQLHLQMVERGVRLGDIVLGNCLVDMYAKCGELEEARQVFASLATKDVVTWTVLIAGYAQQGLVNEALALFKQMELDGLIVANPVTFACLLKACASTGALHMGRHLHVQIVERGLLGDLWLSNCLVDMYSKCGNLKDAHQVFHSLTTKDVVTWNALIAGYAEQGLGQEALVLYGQMEQEDLIFADHVTFACLLNACASTHALQQGRQLHSLIVERGQFDTWLGNCLVDMYTKCGELGDARQVFDGLALKDEVTWNSLIGGYAQQGLGQEAFVLYGEMEQDGLVLANHVTFAWLLRACASSGALQKGREVHTRLVERGLLDNVVLGSSLVDMYAKCGELAVARQVFDSLATKNVVTWNSLIAGCGICDEGRKAVACFEEMLVAGIQPDKTTFTCLLAACSHEGLVHEGRKHFGSMAEEHGVEPTMEHYTGMIDLLGRAGHLDEAENLLLSCESESNVVGLTSLLNACKLHGDVDRARRCFESLLRLEPQSASAYVLMANAYADAGRWTDVDRIETQRTVAGAHKKPAVATVEVKKQVHRFAVGERRDDMALKLGSLKERGHVPQTKVVLKPLCEKEKEDVLCGHAEKLALAFGLLNTPSGTPLLVTKNLRMCSDCHSSTEIMSRVESRHIVVRDAYRVHRFVAGSCSCEGRP